MVRNCGNKEREVFLPICSPSMVVPVTDGHLGGANLSLSSLHGHTTLILVHLSGATSAVIWATEHSHLTRAALLEMA